MQLDPNIKIKIEECYVDPVDTAMLCLQDLDNQ